MVNQLTNQTDKVINWFENIINKNKWSPPVLAEIKERVQLDIDTRFITNEELDYLAEGTWDDWTSFGNIMKNYPLPENELNEIDWVKVGQFLVEVLQLRLWPDEEDEEIDILD
ncbi:hypothetical protein LC612_29730 [Nostoc sp. CHAB 5834]|nr:hypothetical protein [Nostoc sp. CHAB 5834]